jgi:hypothetical protein
LRSIKNGGILGVVRFLLSRIKGESAQSVTIKSDECSAEERVRLVVNQLEAAPGFSWSAGRASRFAEED